MSCIDYSGAGKLKMLDERDIGLEKGEAQRREGGKGVQGGGEGGGREGETRDGEHCTHIKAATVRKIISMSFYSFLSNGNAIFGGFICTMFD